MSKSYTLSVTVPAPNGTTYDDVDTAMLSFIEDHGCRVINTWVTPDDEAYGWFNTRFIVKFSAPNQGAAQQFAMNVLAAGRVAYSELAKPSLSVEIAIYA